MIKLSNIIPVALLFCLSWQPAYAQPISATQQIEIIVMDSRQNPLPGAKLEITPLAGEAKDQIKPSNTEGRIIINWQPQVAQDEGKSADTLYRYLTSFAWKADLAGYLTEAGRIGQQTVERHMASEELGALGAEPAFIPLQQPINLHLPDELFFQPFNNSELRQWCLSFYNKNYQLARELGTPFSWPAFALENEQTLTITLQYYEGGWAGTANASLVHRATLNTYLPWCLLLNEEITPFVQNIKLVFVSSSDINPADPHAWSEDLVLSATIPVAALSQIGLGHSLAKMAGMYPLRLNTELKESSARLSD